MIKLIAATLVLVVSGAPKLTAFKPQDISKSVDSFFKDQKNYRSGDLINQGHTRAVLKKLEQAGWKAKNHSKIVQDTLASSHVLVQTFKSKKGHQFMRKVSGYKNIYDRLDRISNESGGNRLIKDIVKLPDGHRYCVEKPRREIPGLLDFLPKNRSGKTRTIKDYKQPTKKIYTQDQLVKRLEKEWKEDQGR